MTQEVNPIQELRKTIAHLRGPDGCPWDREQTHQSLADCLIEECSELLETIDGGDVEHMREELGDVLLQVIMHARIAEEAETFDLDAIAAEANKKLIRRHPHVFGLGRVQKAEEALEKWEEMKAMEKSGKKGAQTPFKGLPPRLPALLFAREVGRQIEKGNLKTNGALDGEAISTLSREIDEKGAGRMLFNLAAACRLAGIDPESALRRFTARLMESVADADEEAY